MTPSSLLTPIPHPPRPHSTVSSFYLHRHLLHPTHLLLPPPSPLPPTHLHPPSHSMFSTCLPALSSALSISRREFPLPRREYPFPRRECPFPRLALHYRRRRCREVISSAQGKVDLAREEGDLDEGGAMIRDLDEGGAMNRDLDEGGAMNRDLDEGGAMNLEDGDHGEVYSRSAGKRAAR
ncbi:hypothetical protein K525DRAFT_274335 [Schizophyllum commune Loenen D]|nr:hypothetical protein K525DRAFT_274335 [Schizophyllum commune Loenen D]